MLEKPKPVFYAHNARFAGPRPARTVAAQAGALVGCEDVLQNERTTDDYVRQKCGQEERNHDDHGQKNDKHSDQRGDQQGDRLRIMDWNELTARLDAARDLRRVLRREASSNNGGQSEGFAEAAARYFLSKDNDEQPVNPVALGPSKGSRGIETKRNGLLSEEARIPNQAAAEPVLSGTALTGGAREN